MPVPRDGRLLQHFSGSPNRLVQLMAVQKSKKSPSRRGMRRSHSALRPAEISADPKVGVLHRRHHLSDSGFYRGVRYFTPKHEEEIGE